MNRGSRLLEGNGVHQVEGAKYYQLAAGQNSEAARFQAGICLANGQSVPADYIGAAAWFKQAARKVCHRRRLQQEFAHSSGSDAALILLKRESFSKWLLTKAMQWANSIMRLRFRNIGARSTISPQYRDI
jgi:hypothetical protein